MDKLPISLCMFTKNEERNIREAIESVYPIVSEVVILDTGSTDKTVEICKKYTSHIYKVGFTDFGSIRTLSAHLALYPWVLMLDADERILSTDWPNFIPLIDQPEGTADNVELDEEGNVIIDSWALPRKRWADIWMTKQVDTENYPDWQVRLFRNHIDRRIKFVRRVHETVSGCIRTEHSINGPIIHHFQNENKTPEQLKARARMYKALYDADIAEGIEHTEPPVITEDDV